MKLKIIALFVFIYIVVLGVGAAFATDFGDLSFFGKIVELATNMAKMFFNPIKWALDGGVWSMQGFLKYCFKGLLEVAKGAIMAVSLGDLVVNATATWGGLNPTVAWMITQTGFPTGLSMLGAAYSIRFALNLIPAEFTRV